MFGWLKDCGMLLFNSKCRVDVGFVVVGVIIIYWSCVWWMCVFMCDVYFFSKRCLSWDNYYFLL